MPNKNFLIEHEILVLSGKMRGLFVFHVWQSELISCRSDVWYDFERRRCRSCAQLHAHTHTHTHTLAQKCTHTHTHTCSLTHFARAGKFPFLSLPLPLPFSLALSLSLTLFLAHFLTPGKWPFLYSRALSSLRGPYRPTPPSLTLSHSLCAVDIAAASGSQHSTKPDALFEL